MVRTGLCRRLRNGQDQHLSALRAGRVHRSIQGHGGRRVPEQGAHGAGQQGEGDLLGHRGTVKIQVAEQGVLQRRAGHHHRVRRDRAAELCERGELDEASE